MADPTRARMLACLLGGEARTEGELARAGGVTPQAATSQLAQLEHAGLICARRQGRHKYFTLADADVAHVLLRAERLAASQTGQPCLAHYGSRRAKLAADRRALSTVK